MTKTAHGTGRQAGPLIRWYDHHHFTGYVFATMRGGRRHVRYFSAKPAGRKAALERARAYRDWLLPRLPPPTRLKRKYVRNTSGVIGVCLCRERTRQGGIAWRYAAFWPIKGGRKGRATFSVSKYGKREARRLAIEARKKGEAAYVASMTFQDYKQSATG